jgi:hypothetical protein
MENEKSWTYRDSNLEIIFIFLKTSVCYFLLTPSFPSSQIQVFSSEPCSLISTIYGLHLRWKSIPRKPSPKLKTRWPESASELYRPNDRRLSATLVPNLVDRWCHIVSVTDPFGRILCLLVATFSIKQLLNCTHEAEWTPFQTHYFSENLVAPGIEPGPLDL